MRPDRVFDQSMDKTEGGAPDSLGNRRSPLTKTAAGHFRPSAASSPDAIDAPESLHAIIPDVDYARPAPSAAPTLETVGKYSRSRGSLSENKSGLMCNMWVITSFVCSASHTRVSASPNLPIVMAPCSTKT